ncbi:glutamate racemase [Lactobacillus sp. ESL0684]|uniref:glutamate racemase n=1 Tax=Lactobacillus sp. ESL0684 TaxID=2983213 RepID=UPI0023F9334A|nr:glutamate racemase [Lactobacillus sp. ESL0684]WEV43295.1 glutamate racemase [Lactobacillus sp. ESL0684]
MTDNRPIGLLDSGVGGLTVVKQVIKQMPNESTIFIGDNGHVPYGDKTQAEIVALTRQSVDFLIRKNAKVIIFACNTATVAALDILQKEVAVSLVGIVQAGALAAVRATKNQKVAVVATDYTIKQDAYLKAIKARDAGIAVTQLATPTLVPLIEQAAEPSVTMAAVKTAIKPLKQQEFDTLVLGCTHYPILQAEFAQVLGPKITLVDPAVQVTKETAVQLRKADLLAANVDAKHEYYTTGDVAMVDKLGKKILGDPEFAATKLTGGEE